MVPPVGVGWGCGLYPGVVRSSAFPHDPGVRAAPDDPRALVPPVPLTNRKTAQRISPSARTRPHRPPSRVGGVTEVCRICAMTRADSCAQYISISAWTRTNSDQAAWERRRSPTLRYLLTPYPRPAASSGLIRGWYSRVLFRTIPGCARPQKHPRALVPAVPLTITPHTAQS